MLDLKTAEDFRNYLKTNLQASETATRLKCTMWTCKNFNYLTALQAHRNIFKNNFVVDNVNKKQ